MSDNGDILDPDIKETRSSDNGNGEGQLPNAVATLVLGILSIVGCTTYGVIGIICGVIALALHTKDKRLYQSNNAYYENSYKLANAGYICAIIGTALSAIGILFLIIVFAGAATAGRF